MSSDNEAKLRAALDAFNRRDTKPHLPTLTPNSSMFRPARNVDDHGDRVIANVRMHAKARASGVEATMPIVMVLDVRDGKTVRSRHYLEHEYADAEA